MTLINIADLKDPDDPQGRSYREVNAAKSHSIPIGALVETTKGVQLPVLSHHRDCDGTPLYTLGNENAVFTGYDEDSLKVVSSQ